MAFPKNNPSTLYCIAFYVFCHGNEFLNTNIPNKHKVIVTVNIVKWNRKYVFLKRIFT